MGSYILWPLGKQYEQQLTLVTITVLVREGSHDIPKSAMPDYVRTSVLDAVRYCTIELNTGCSGTAHRWIVMVSLDRYYFDPLQKPVHPSSGSCLFPRNCRHSQRSRNPTQYHQVWIFWPRWSLIPRPSHIRSPPQDHTTRPPPSRQRWSKRS